MTHTTFNCRVGMRRPLQMRIAIRFPRPKADKRSETRSAGSQFHNYSPLSAVCSRNCVCRVRIRAASNVSSLNSPTEASENQPENSSRHAVLHDFCMSIPYGATAVLGGLISALIGWRGLGFAVSAGGILICLLSAASLRAWKARKSCTLFTSTGSGISASLAILSARSLLEGSAISFAAKAVIAAFAVLSASLALFLVYNIFAGGNPPPSAAAAEAPPSQ
mmetsp:Transcript_10035/g.23922  ORF Transcript_10035/g.23922 Transcript_10035/m.23922 type:complete len:221 (+) Transcript_10035:285-947(+)